MEIRKCAYFGVSDFVEVSIRILAVSVNKKLVGSDVGVVELSVCYV